MAIILPHSIDTPYSLKNREQTIIFQKNMEVNSPFSLINCNKLVYVPPDINFNSSVSFAGCSALTTIRAKKYGGDLNLTWCRKLTSLPDNMEVAGNLDLEECTSLTRLPKKLKVEGYLCLCDCTKLKALPDDIQVGKGIYIRGSKITEIPVRLIDSVEDYHLHIRKQSVNLKNNSGGVIMMLEAGKYRLAPGDQLINRKGEYRIVKNTGRVFFISSESGGFDVIPDEQGYLELPEEATVSPTTEGMFLIESGEVSYLIQCIMGFPL